MGLFFVTIGMMLDIGQMFANLGWVILLLLGILLLKATVIALLVAVAVVKQVSLLVRIHVTVSLFCNEEVM